MGSEDTRIAGRRGSAPIPQLAQGVFPLCPFNPAEINLSPVAVPACRGRVPFDSGSYTLSDGSPHPAVDEKVDLERVLGVSVDLALKGGIARRPRLMHAVEAEAVYV